MTNPELADLKKTPLAETHDQLGATMVDFGGWYMPVQYTTVIDEHNTCRTKAVLFDVSHMGEIEVKGKGAVDFIQKIVTNDISKLVPFKALYSPMCYPNGTFVDDLIVYKINDEFFYLVVNASNTEKDFEWIMQHKHEYVEVKDVSNEIAELALQGPMSEKILQKVTETKLSQIKYFHVIEGKVAGIKTFISRTGYTGEDGFELYFPAEKAVEMWNAIIEAGAEFGIKPAGLGARDTLRMESGYSLYGNDIDNTNTPIEAGLGWTVKFTKEFIGREVLEKQKTEGVTRKLIGFEMIDRGIARHNHEIYKDNNKIGYVTSGTFSPTFKKAIGMCYINKPFDEIGTEIDIKIRDKLLKAKVVDKRFHKKK